MPSPDAIVLPEVTTVAIRLDPVQTIINSMVLLIRSEDLSGLNSWIYETAAAMAPELVEQHNLVIIGLHHSVLPTRLWKDFPSFLAHLEKSDPIALRDKMLDYYLDHDYCEEDDQKLDATRETLLKDEAFFLDYLRNKFGSKNVIPEIETKAFELMNAPEAMKKTIVAHMSYMWQEFYQTEWDKIKPMLEDAVLAFEKIDFSSMSRDETYKYITGREVDQHFWNKTNQKALHLVFVPSAHSGPYMGQFHYKNALGVIFGARLPKDAEVDAPDLSRNEITVRLSALADDIRLHILKLIAEEGELRSQELMERMDLSQSAASRHLKQLSATGYLIERRCSGAKCYSLNEERIQDTLKAVSAFLLLD
jgi:DNA-binding transcriptional ArsR family regulator